MGLQGVTWGYMGLQGFKRVKGVSRRLHGVTEGYMKLQWVTRGY